MCQRSEQCVSLLSPSLRDPVMPCFVWLVLFHSLFRHEIRPCFWEHKCCYTHPLPNTLPSPPSSSSLVLLPFPVAQAPLSPHPSHQGPGSRCYLASTFGLCQANTLLFPHSLCPCPFHLPWVLYCQCDNILRQDQLNGRRLTLTYCSRYSPLW